MNEAHPRSTGDVDALWEWNLITGRAHFSPRWLALLGRDGQNLRTTPDEWLQHVHPDDAALVQQALDALRQPGPDRFEFSHRMRHNDGTYRWVCCRGSVHRNDLGDAIRLSGSHTDITVDVVMDPVTRLPNQLLLLDHISRAIDRARRQPGFQYAVVAFDLGRRSVGAIDPDPDVDAVLLQAAARRLETSLRTAEPVLRGGPERDLVARLDGDSFAVLLEGLKDMTQAEQSATRLLQALLGPFTMNGAQTFLSASAGVAVSATGYTRPEDMLRDAQTAAHRARVLGGSRCELFDSGSLDLELAESQMELDLTAAVDRDELRVFYQPIIELEHERVIGFEALVRWQHPTLGLLLPARFIPLSEKSGAIVPLGRWVLREACVQLRAWQTAHPSLGPLWMSVNLSTLQLRDPGLFDDVVDALREAALDPRCLALELTEGIAVDNADAVKTVLMQLRAVGVRISVDDFGTGYSALGYLRQLPIDTLKIDRSFVHGMEGDPERSAIVRTLLTMAQQLELAVIAEGVENKDQVGLLRSLGCPSVQGYLFARPLDAVMATSLLQAEVTSAPAKASQVRRVTTVTKGWRLAPAGVVLGVLAVTLAMALAYFRVPPAETALSSSPSQASAHQAASDIALPAAVVAVAPTRTLAPAAPASMVWSAPVVETHVAKPASSPPVAAAVVHDHVFGSCRGHLEVSGAGLRFATDSASDKDGFLLTFGSFRYALREGTLTIKVADRDYRFRARTPDEASALQSVEAALTRHSEADAHASAMTSRASPRP